MYEYFNNLFLTNDIFSGALFAGGLLGLLASSRQYFVQFFNLVIAKNVIEFTITSSDRNFIYFLMWLSKHNFSSSIRKYHITSNDQPYTPNRIVSDDDNEEKKKEKFIVGPDNSRYLFKHKKKFFILSSSVEKPTAGGNNNSPQVHKSITLKYLGWNEEYLNSILDDVIKIKEKYLTDLPRVYSPNSWAEDWTSKNVLKEKNMDYVFLPKDKKDMIINHVSEFLDSKKIYEEFNIPYKTGILLYGVPGSGKTTLLRAIASKYKLNLYFLPFSGKVLEAKNLSSLFEEIKPKSLIVLEDIDTLFDSKDSRETKEESLNFSTLLNITDGPVFSEETILIMTTNHIEKLDKALIRAGRINLKIAFDYADEEQKRDMFLHFNKKLDEKYADQFVKLIDDVKELSTADLQTYLLHYKGLDALSVKNLKNIKFEEDL